MIVVDFPDGRQLQLKRAVFDYNGTLAFDGRLSLTVRNLLQELAGVIAVTVITADTFGLVRQELTDIEGVNVVVLEGENGGEAKERYALSQGADNVVAIGNGANDRRMFGVAALAIAVLGPEGAARETLSAADIVTASPEAAIGLLLNTRRLIATLRR